MVHLHCRSWYSFLQGASSPKALVEVARSLGQPAVALTDLHGVYGCVEMARACREAGLRHVPGATLRVVGAPGEPGADYLLVLLARDARGYHNLCRLLTDAHARARTLPHALQSQRPAQPAGEGLGYAPWLPWDALQSTSCEGLFCLTGGSDGYLGKLLRGSRHQAAASWLRALAQCFPAHLYVELVHRQQPGDGLLVREMARLAAHCGLPCVVSNAVRYATSEDFALYDALLCVHLGITVADPHPARPVNDAATLLDEAELRRLLPYPEAFANTLRIAEACQVELLPDGVTPPAALLPPGHAPASWLSELCTRGLRRRYRGASLTRARRQLAHELGVVCDLGLCDFFLVVHEVVSYARTQGIRCAGRGSAANSIIAYLLGITTVDPLEHRLLFERFLHRGRKGMPDIDVDFDAERRPEVIAWMEQRFGAEHTAMTANVNRYRLRSGLRDLMKVLGWDLVSIGRVARLFSHRDGLQAPAERRGEIVEVLGRDAPMLDVLFALLPRLRHCPRHLSLHNGGMILSRAALTSHTPLQLSANGVRQVQFDKDDIEALGLIKLDVLGLRSLAVVSEALRLHQEDGGAPIPIDDLPLDDDRTFELIRSGQTMSVFQIESPGQWNMLSRVQPRTFDDLVVEVALFRPGPLQGGMVNPYIERRRGRAPVRFAHPSLARVLGDTYGVILYQEQVLEVCHAFAGLSLEESDRFRSLMSKWRDPGDMSAMRERFVASAMQMHGVERSLADAIFDQVAAFVGYGFCRSHAAAFALTVYHTAWLKAHHPAAYMAAVLQHHPGFYPLSTVLEEVKHLGIRILPVDVLRSAARYRLEGGAIRLPLTQVHGVSLSVAQAIIEARRWGDALPTLVRRAGIAVEVWDALARAGALDALGERREVLWQLGLWRKEQAASRLQGELWERAPSSERETSPAVLAGAPTPWAHGDGLTPPLLALTPREVLAWDYETLGLSPQHHPVGLYREELASIGCRPLCELGGCREGEEVQVAGVVVVLQRPPTAKGMIFLVLEDETARISAAITPDLYEPLRATLRSPVLWVQGKVQVAGEQYRSLLVRQAAPLALARAGAHRPGKDRHVAMWARTQAQERLVGQEKAGYSGNPPA